MTVLSLVALGVAVAPMASLHWLLTVLWGVRRSRPMVGDEERGNTRGLFPYFTSLSTDAWLQPPSTMAYGSIPDRFDAIYQEKQWKVPEGGGRNR